ncbi:transmembrane protein, putative, partial [Bodo saltans]
MQALRNMISSKQHHASHNLEDETNQNSGAPIIASASSKSIRRLMAVIAVSAFLYFLSTEVLMMSMDVFRVPGGSPTEVKGVAAKPANNFVFATGALPFVLMFSFGNPKSQRRVLLLALSVIASVVLMICTASYLQLLCAYSAKDMAQLCDLALEIQSDVEHTFGAKKLWIIKGNLLAVARKQSDINYLIANDHDFDYCGAPELFDDEKLVKHLQSKGMMFERGVINERGTRKVTVFPHNLPLYKYHSGPPMVDIDECDVPTELLPVEGCNKGTFYISNKWEEWLN